MKNLLYTFAILCLIIGTYSCKPCPKCDTQIDDEVTLTVDDTISLQKFQTWVNNWDMYGQGYIADTLTQYFTMPLVDITEFLDNRDSTTRDSVVAARFYLGMELEGGDTIPHILLVGVDSKGDSLTNELDKQYIYDLSKPCPSMCGPKSLPKKKK